MTAETWNPFRGLPVPPNARKISPMGSDHAHEQIQPQPVELPRRDITVKSYARIKRQQRIVDYMRKLGGSKSVAVWQRAISLASDSTLRIDLSTLKSQGLAEIDQRGCWYATSSRREVAK